MRPYIWHEQHLEKSISGRYLSLEHIEPLIQHYASLFDVETIGYSVQDRLIYKIELGTGPTRILMWSQMHGNESTTTKAVFDLLKFFAEGGATAKKILEKCTLCILPMLNPDGAYAYTRVNANEIDLNRDAQDRSQPESVVLRKVFEAFKPDFCFNLHDQRTIFSAGNHALPATVSFLSPSEDEDRSVTITRRKSMEVIAHMNEKLQQLIPGQIGRFDDGFNLNCIGDTFQALGVPTVLFESGHFQGDYLREQTRKYIFTALVAALEYIASQEVTGDDYESYFDIPENDKLFLDIIIRNYEGQDIGILYKEVLKEDKLRFIPVMEKKGDLKMYYGHVEIDYNKSPLQTIEIRDFGVLDTEKLLKII